MRYVPSWTSVSAAASVPDETASRGDEPHSLPRVAIAAAALGNATEWFDYGIYAYGLAYISAALFPGNTASATLFALGTFAISFLIRPLGGLFWGPLGDRLGRKRVLALTVLTMSGATLLVGVLPTFATAGWLAPAALIVLRMVQGFSTGGEYGGAATFIAEYAPDSRRGLCSSFLEFATLAGFSLVALNVVNYVLLAYMPTYMHKELVVSENMSLLIPLIGMLAMMVLLPFAGWLSDRVGRKTMWWISLVGLFVAAVPMFTLMTHGVLGAFVGFAVLGLLYVPQLATISAMFPAMFPTHVRYAGMAIAYNVSTSLFGGTAPIVNDWLIGKTGNTMIPAYYMMAACAVGLVALAGVIETRGCSLRGETVPGKAG